MLVELSTCPNTSRSRSNRVCASGGALSRSSGGMRGTGLLRGSLSFGCSYQPRTLLQILGAGSRANQEPAILSARGEQEASGRRGMADRVSETFAGAAEQPELEIAWRPSDVYVRRSRLRRVMERHGLANLDALQRRSTEDLEWFWRAVSDDLELEWYEPFERVTDLSRGAPWARWFPGGRINYVHNCLDKHVRAGRGDKPALIWEGEDGEVRRLSYAELLTETNRLANALRSLGIGVGDRVGIFMPMVTEVAIASLACSKIGAVYIPLFSGYAAAAVASRLQDGETRLLITADGFYRRGQIVAMKEVADEAAGLSPSVEKVLVYRRLGREVPWSEGRDIWWDEAVPSQSADCETEQTDAEDPVM